MKRRIAIEILAALLLPASLAAQQAPQSVSAKYALVIGNGNYTAVSRLRNPANDANDMKTTLEGLGFTVDLIMNGSLGAMEEGVERLKNRLSLSKDSYGFFFYAGHGVQSGGENYLIPVDAEIRSETYLRTRALAVSIALEDLQHAGNILNIVVLDACRDNPFSWARSGSRGLTVVGAQPPGSIIVYATSAGSTAQDGEGRNGLFTAQLLNNLKTPGLEVSELFRRVGGDVQRESNTKQIPAIYSQFFGSAYLGGRPPAVTPAPVPVTPRPTPVQPAVQTQRPVPADFVSIEGEPSPWGAPGRR
jgi:uncharacterized caspase-like protein